MSPEEVDLDELPMEEQDLSSDDDDDLDEYSFSKFASMSFQGAATPTHVRHRLAQPLIHHEDEGDVQVHTLSLSLSHSLTLGDGVCCVSDGVCI